MHKFSSINVKRSLIGFISDSISNLFSKHALVAPNIVGHDVLELRHKGLFVDNVEINQFLGGHLDSNVTLNIVDETSHV